MRRYIKPTCKVVKIDCTQILQTSDEPRLQELDDGIYVNDGGA